MHTHTNMNTRGAMSAVVKALFAEAVTWIDEIEMRFEATTTKVFLRMCTLRLHRLVTTLIVTNKKASKDSRRG